MFSTPLSRVSRSRRACYVFFLSAGWARLSAQDPSKLWDAARGVLEKSCHACHGANGKAASDFVVLDPSELKSKLAEVRERVLVNKEMPPADHKASFQARYGVSAAALKQLQLTPETTGAIQRWLDGGGVIVTEPGSGAAGTLVRDEDLIAVLLKDVQSLGPDDQKYARYLLLANLLRAGENVSRMAVYRNAVRKTLASITWKSELPSVTIVPNSEGTALRFDLRDLIYPFDNDSSGGKPKLGCWPSTLWDEIASRNPYELPVVGEQAADLKEALGTSYVFLRADWFVTEVTKPQVYARVLGLPHTVQELETGILGVDVAKDIQTGTARRAGTTDSGVSSNHRIIERHPQPAGGYYWVSYDFREPKGRANILDFPTGPGSGPTDFEHAGGEFIFSLPDGLQAYFLAKATGEPLEAAPTDIVQNSSRKDAVVLNGISCMECHASGMRDINDQLRAFIAATVDQAAILSEVRRLHPGPVEIKKLLDQDRARFLGAIARLKLEEPTEKSDREAEPISRLVSRFEDTKVGVRIAAAELDLSEAEFETEFKSKLVQRSSTLRRLYARLKHTTVSRAEFVDEFARLRRQFFEGQLESRASFDPRKPSAASGGMPTVGRSFKVPGVDIEMIWIAPGSFTMGSPRGELFRVSDETQHEVHITKGFWLAKTETTQKQYSGIQGSNPSSFKSAGEYAPVEEVLWENAKEFCRQLNQQEQSAGRLPDGFEYCLPTEAQWEFAARAGSNGPIYGSDLDSISWNLENSQSTTHPVGQKKPNAWGLYDMIGNVWEWCSDYYGDYPTGRVLDPVGPAASEYHVYRGGSLGNDERSCRAAIRNWSKPEHSSNYLGFRLALRSVRK